MKVQVLLSMRDARAYLADQIDSLIWQELRPWRYLARDAGSADDSVDIVRRYDLRIAPEVIEADAGDPNAAAHDILRRASGEAELYAFCGGDDLWHEHKLASAARHFGAAGEAPRLYCARTRMVRADGRVLGLSPMHAGRLTLLRLLLEPAVIGPTIVVNRAARGLILQNPLPGAPFWPWAMALTVAATGGTVAFDATPVADIRLHPGKWLAEAESVADPAMAVRASPRAASTFLRRHLALLGGLRDLSPQARHVLGAVDAALTDKASRRALADHPDLDDGPLWRTLRLKRRISRALEG